jgi:hypothetical protein
VIQTGYLILMLEGYSDSNWISKHLAVLKGTMMIIGMHLKVGMCLLLKVVQCHGGLANRLF